MKKIALLALFGLLPMYPCAGCSSTSSGGTPDSGSPDTGNPDVVNTDSSRSDSANQDVSNPDSGSPDSGNPDVSNPDGASPDGVSPDGSPSAPHLVFSTYLGGTTACTGCSGALTFALNNATDSNGNIYVTGTTQVSDFPVLNAVQAAPATGSTTSAFVTKLSPAGQIVWSTYLGGDNGTIGVGLAAMPGGGVVVAGLTTSDSSGPFPAKNALQAANNGLSDYFVTVFDADGQIQYSTYFGGSGVEGEAGVVFADDSSNGNNVAVDSNGLIYFTGITTSGGSETVKLPVTSNAAQPAFGGLVDAFLCIIDPTKTGDNSLVYTSFLGGSKQEKGHGIAVNSGGTAITITGYTKSDDFPTTSNGFRSTPPPSGFTSNGFVAQFQSSDPGSTSSQYTSVYATYLGANSGEARDDCYSVTADSNGLLILTGRTQSADFPMGSSSSPSIYNSAPYLEAGVSNDEPYLVKLNPALSGTASLVYSTFLGGGAAIADAGDGGGGGSFCTRVAVDSNGVSYVVGETSAQGTLYAPSGSPAEAPTLYPYTQDALLKANQGSIDALHMQVSPSGSILSYSTFLGGHASDRAYGLSVDSSGNVIMSGLTYSSDFPVKNAAQNWPDAAGKMNAFVTKLGR